MLYGNFFAFSGICQSYPTRSTSNQNSYYTLLFPAFNKNNNNKTLTLTHPCVKILQIHGVWRPVRGHLDGRAAVGMRRRRPGDSRALHRATLVGVEPRAGRLAARRREDGEPRRVARRHAHHHFRLYTLAGKLLYHIRV